MEFSVDTLERAVCQFYQSDATIQAEAHEWLEKAKRSSEAWIFVWDLLQPQKTSEVQFFAATTLHMKVKHSLGELTPENATALRDRLMTAIVAYSTGPKIILNRLCISLSAYFLRMCPEKWPDALPSLLFIFTPENLPSIPADRVLWVLFEILTVLPEEFSSMQLAPQRKGLVHQYLIENMPAVVRLLEKVLSSYTDEEVIQQAVKCASSWVTIGVSFAEYQNLCNIIVNLIISTHKLHPSICEKALEFSKVVVGLPENYKYPTYLLEFLERILPLVKIIGKELMLGDSMDRKLIGNIYHLFLTFGETHSRQLLNWIKLGGEERGKVLILISYILQCSAAKGFYPKDETYSRLTFGFWYVLQDEIVLSSPKDCKLYMKYLGPIYKELVNVLITKAQLPDPELNFSKQDLESFRCYRQDISDMLMYCHNILRETIICLIQSKLDKINVNECKWQELEACLFTLCSVSENLYPEENTFLPSLLQYIRNLPFQRLDPKVFSTALDTIGAYANCISAHSSTLEYVVPLIICGLNVPETTSSATMALKDIARCCEQDIKPYSSLILDASQAALHGGRLKLNDCQRLMCTVGMLLSSLSLDTIMHYLNLILTPYVNQLNALALQEPSAQVKNNILFCLKMVGVLSTTLNTKLESNSDLAEVNRQAINNEPQPVLLILQKLLPDIKLIADSWSADEQVMQSLFVLLKQSVTTLLEDCQSIITDILALIVSTYRVHPQPAALDLSKTLSTLFGKDEKYQPVMQSLVNELCTVAMTRVSSSQCLSDHTDLLESLFVYLAQIAKRMPKLLLGTNTALLFECAIITLAIPELPTVKSAVSFLVNFIVQSMETESLKSIVIAYGEQLIHQIVSCIGGKASRSNVEPLASILLALNVNYPSAHSQWLHKAVTENSCPSSNLQQRQAFVSAILNSRRNKDQVQNAINSYGFAWRGSKEENMAKA